MKPSDKVHKSIFDPSITIDTPNMLAELVMDNYFKNIRKPTPKFPFWRTAYTGGDNTWLKFISKKYQLEVIFIKRLLKKYHAKAIATLVKDLNLGTIALQKKDDKENLMKIFDKYQAKMNEDLAKPVVSREIIKDSIPNEYSLFKLKLKEL